VLRFIGNGSEVARFFTTGNLGINTTTDAGFKLDVNGTARVATSLNTPAVFSTGNLILYAGFTNRGRIDLFNSTTGLAIDFLGNGNSRMQLHSNGNLLIGTTTDAGFKLDVNGTARVGVLTCGNINPSGLTSVSGLNIAVGLIDNQPTNNLRIISKGTIYSDDYSFLSSASAMLEVKSTTKGFLPPRMTNAQRAAISSPAVGLVVYCTDAVEGLYVYKSTGWAMASLI